MVSQASGPGSGDSPQPARVVAQLRARGLSGLGVVGDPVAGDGRARAQPDAFVTLHVLDEPGKRADPARATNDAPVQANAHHARPSCLAQSVEPVERVPAIAEELLAGTEVTAALQA